MERLLARVLMIFAVGFTITGIAVAAYPTRCGSLFTSSSCDKHTPGQVIAVIILIGLAITSAVAADEAKSAVQRPPEEPPTVYPGGAQV